MSERASGDSIDPRPPAAATAEPAPGPPPVTEPPYPGPGLPDPAVMPYPVGPYTMAPYPVTAAPYPVTAAPYPYAFAAPPPRRGPWVVVLGITTGVFLLAAGALGALWFVDHDEATRESADQVAQLEELREQVAQLEEDVEEAETRLQRAEDDLVASEECPEAVQTFIDVAMDAAATGGTAPPTAEAQRAAFDMINACGVVP